MKVLSLLIVVTMSIFCQDSNDFKIYGNVGIGLSRGGYQTPNAGTLARLGVSASYYHLIFKFDRTVNNEIPLLDPPEKITSYSYLAGIAIQPFPKRPDVILNGKYGFGKGERIKRGKVIFYRSIGDNDHEFISEKYSTKIIEIDVELRFQIFGMYLGGFYEFDDGFSMRGVTVGVIFGNF